MFNKLTPVMFVSSIEPCLPFWKQLGFDVTVEVPHGEALGFVILNKDKVEVMYQTRASIAEDIPALAEEPSRHAFYLEVASLDEIAKCIGDAPVVVPRRKTFYGADELGVRDPAGNMILFAQVP